ncbi:MAG: hypothetical protein RBS68_09805 [Anaerolineales bacterium]|jgi:hypothetical protein|nr:hypothetical protein [Anaerolineales bacterium]
MTITPVSEIERAVSRLSAEDLTRFRKWFEQFDAQKWDRQFEADVKAGRLDRIAEQALADYDAGNVQEL